MCQQVAQMHVSQMVVVVMMMVMVVVICSVDFKWTIFGLWHFALSYMCPVVSCFWIP